VDQAELWERKCAAYRGVAIVYANKHDGPTDVVVRSVTAPTLQDDTANHLAECSVMISSGRLAVSGWESSVVVGELAVPEGPLRVRIGWHGLTEGADFEDWDQERFELTVFPGPLAPVEVLRWWPAWIPPPAESTTAEGLRRFTGPQAAKARASMEPMKRSFWPPYPTTADVRVTSLWRDPADGSNWAHGTGSGGDVLVELSHAEFERLVEEGFPQVRTYARDAEGRVWTADQMPLERAPALLYVKPENWAYLRQLLPADDMQLVELPDGWSRITRRAFDGSGSLEHVETIENDGADGFYQRWPDGAELPP
jgi:hypothetical protein